MMNPRRILSLSTILCLTAPLLAQGEVDLRTTAKKGSSVWLAQLQKQEQNIDMGGQEMETSQTTTRIVQVTVKDVDDKGNLVVETKIARVHGSVTMPMGMGDMEFDSATPEEKADDEGMAGMGAMMTKALMAGAGKLYTAKVSPFGKVVELMPDAAEIVKSSSSGMMGGGIDEGSLKKIVEDAFGTLPEKATAVGGKWEHKQKDSKNRMSVEHKMEMTLAKADADSFEITAVGTVQKAAEGADEKDEKGEKEDDAQAAMAKDMMKSMKIKSGKLTGTQRVSRKDGFVLDATNTVAMDVEMKAGPMGEMQMAVKVTASTKRTTSDAAAPGKKDDKKEKDEKKDDKKEPKKDEKKEAGK